MADALSIVDPIDALIKELTDSANKNAENVKTRLQLLSKIRAFLNISSTNQCLAANIAQLNRFYSGRRCNRGSNNYSIKEYTLSLCTLLDIIYPSNQILDTYLGELENLQTRLEKLEKDNGRPATIDRGLIGQLAHYVDFKYPPVLTPSKCSWVTHDIHILIPGTSLLTKTNFGKFLINITYRGGTTGLVFAEFIAITPVAAQNFVRSTTRNVTSTHPHIQSDNKPCLGNAQDLMRNAIRDGNYPVLIQVVNAYLQSYNKHSPYSHLAHLEFNAEVGNTQCECKLARDYQCACPDCEFCGKRKIAFAACGCCVLCCAKKHAKTQPGMGINGSNCILSAYANLLAAPPNTIDFVKLKSSYEQRITRT